MRKIYRYEVPIDDQVHEISLSGGEFPVVAAVVLAQSGPYLEFWCVFDDGVDPVRHKFRVVGTGHEVKYNEWHVLTAPRVDGLVFHLVQTFR